MFQQHTHGISEWYSRVKQPNPRNLTVNTCSQSWRSGYFGIPCCELSSTVSLGLWNVEGFILEVTDESVETNQSTLGSEYHVWFIDDDIQFLENGDANSTE